MIYSLRGKITVRQPGWIIVETGGVGFKVFISEMTGRALSGAEGETSLFTYFHLREDAASLYGFKSEQELSVFELLISVSGVGPKSALAILSVAPLDNLLAAIKEGRPELLTRVSGVGRKTAERVIVELRDKVQTATGADFIKTMESDSDIEDALANLGYPKPTIREAIKKIDPAVTTLEGRLKAALQLLKK